MPKGIFLIIPALLIDGFQALLSLALAGVFAGAGAAVGAVPFVGTAAAAGIVPIGILLGFALNIAIAAAFGAGLTVLLAFNGMFYPRYLIAGGGELVPGLNNLPFWTLMTLLCILRKNREAKVGGVVAGAVSFAVRPTRAVMHINQTTTRLRGASMQGSARRSREETPLPETGEDLVRAARSRERLQDIRAPKPNAQTA